MHAEIGGVNKHEQGGLVARDSATAGGHTSPADKPEGSAQRQVLLLHYCLAPGAFCARLGIGGRLSALYAHSGQQQSAVKILLVNHSPVLVFAGLGNPNLAFQSTQLPDALCCMSCGDSL